MSWDCVCFFAAFWWGVRQLQCVGGAGVGSWILTAFCL